MKTARKTLRFCRKQHYALKDEQGQITNNRDEVIKVVEEFYQKLYSLLGTSVKPLLSVLRY